MDYTYMPIKDDGAEKLLRRLIGRLTIAMDEEALRDAGGRDQVPVIQVD